MKYINTLKFSKDVLFSHELRANNCIEGYRDDVEVIDEVIRKSSGINDTDRKLRILNLYKGYKYILKRNNIDKDTLKHLYNCHNDKKKITNIYHEMLLPLIDKEILIPGRSTNKQMSGIMNNHFFTINPNLYDNDPDKIKCIKL